MVDFAVHPWANMSTVLSVWGFEFSQANIFMVPCHMTQVLFYILINPLLSFWARWRCVLCWYAFWDRFVHCACCIEQTQTYLITKIMDQTTLTNVQGTVIISNAWKQFTSLFFRSLPFFSVWGTAPFPEEHTPVGDSPLVAAALAVVVALFKYSGGQGRNTGIRASRDGL